MSQGSAGRAIGVAGLLAGVLDINAAFLFYLPRGVSPVVILKSVASGLLGPAAFKGGPEVAALGLLLHFVIAFGAAAVYYAASRWLPVLAQKPWICGPLFGIAVYFFMSLVVLPLSSVTPRPFNPDPIMILIHMLCVGTPIAWAVRRHGG
ncbi:MAG TPA: hypothetical protein VI589_03425 [Vicinamibacteria bacterium]